MTYKNKLYSFSYIKKMCIRLKAFIFQKKNDKIIIEKRERISKYALQYSYHLNYYI